MKNIVLYLLLLFPLASRAQLPDDSLKSICIDLYRAENNKSKNLQNTGKVWIPNFEVDELFKGYFVDVKVLRLTDATDLFIDKRTNDTILLVGHGDRVSRLYFLNPVTGKENEINDIDAFNKAFRGKALSNLDKCYLYLFAVVKIKEGLTKPYLYRKVIKKSSVFSELYALFHTYCHIYTDCDGTNIRRYPLAIDMETYDDINSSTKKNIIVYVVKRKSTCSCEIQYIDRYHFFLDSDGNIRNVSITKRKS